MSKVTPRARLAPSVAIIMVLMAPDRLLDPSPTRPLSRSRTFRTPLSARWNEVLNPAIPAPTMMTDCDVFAMLRPPIGRYGTLNSCHSPHHTSQ